MKKYMLVTVGVGRGVDMAVTFSVNRNNPDVLYLLYSRGSLVMAESIKERLSVSSRISIFDKQFEEVDDVEMLIREYVGYIDDILAEGGDLSNITADYTSGTKSMSAALVSACLLKGVGYLSVVSGKRDNANGGIVIAGTERLNVLSPVLIFTEERLKVFKMLFNKYRFQSAVDVMTSGVVYHELRDRVNFLILIAKGYDAWDRFDYKAASECMNQADLSVSDLYGIRKTIELHKQILHRLKTSDGIQLIDAEDLFCNALRRAKESRYDDAVSRLYRLVELYAQMEFKSFFGFETGHVDISKIPETVSVKLRPDEKGKYKIALYDSFECMRESTRPIVKKYFERLGELRSLLSIRNDSKLAHGHRPISKEQCENMIALVNDIFDVKEVIHFPELT
jgi:CRISPR-associated protein (TIGR02710 family)